MGFLLLSESAGVDVRRQQEDAVLHRLGCKICPLAKIENNHPDMPPSGSATPLIYCLGEAPGAEEDRKGVQFIGSSGQLLRELIPYQFKERIRWNNCVRTRPPGNATPERVELECCRPSVERDIEATKPKAIFGFGEVPLTWVSGFRRISDWRGRRMPVRVGNHACWFYPFYHPAFILHLEQLRKAGDMTEEERVLRLDLRRAFHEVEKLPAPAPHDPAKAFEGVEVLPGTGAPALRKLETLLMAAARAPVVGVDYETHGLRPYAADARILTAAVSTPDLTFAFPFDHPGAQWSKQHRKDLGNLWRRFLLHCKGVKAVHMLAFELEWTGFMFGADLVRAGRWEDTASQACIIDERKGGKKPGCFALEFLVQQYFGFNLKQLSSVDRNRLIEEPLTDVLRYNGGDAKYHRLLWQPQREEIERQELTEAYRLALRRVPTVVLSQLRGAPVDQEVVGRLSVKYDTRIKELEKKIHALPVTKRFQVFARRPFNPSSPKDVIALFHDMLKYVEEMTIYDRGAKKHRLSSDETVLEKIVSKEPLAQLILDLRKAQKLKSTYIDPLSPLGLNNEESVVYPDGMIHTQFNTIFAETGRLSSDGPNLQNFPKREDEAKEVRRPLKAAPRSYILAFDYGQIEARVIAMFTKDKRFVDALWSDFDVHMDWAQRIATDYPSRIGGRKLLTDKGAMKKFRGDIKNQWTFPLFFGAKLQSVAGYLDIPEEVLKPHFNAFWKEFSGVRKWQEELLDFYHHHGYVECLTGRRRRGPLSINQVYNSPVQGTAAEIVLDAMSRLSETGDPELQPEINIHDDLTFLRVREERFEEFVPKVVDAMLAVPFRWAKVVPISVELSVGYNWMKMDEIGVFKSNEWFKDNG